MALTGKVAILYTLAIKAFFLFFVAKFFTPLEPPYKDLELLSIDYTIASITAYAGKPINYSFHIM